MHRGVREGRRALRGQAAHVVGVQVGDHDVVHLLGLVAGGLQVFQQLAERGAEQAAGTGIHQHEACAGVHQEGVHGRFERRLQVGAGECGLGSGGRRLQQLVDRQVHRAVAECGDLDVTEHHAEIAGGLRLDHRRGRQPRRGQHGHHGKEGGGDGGARRTGNEGDL